MANRTKKVVMTAERRASLVAEMTCAGKSQVVIAKELGLTQGRVSQIMAEKRLEWNAKEQVAVADHIKIEVAKLDSIYSEALAGWERSTQDAVAVTSKKVKPYETKDEKINKKLVKAKKELLLVSQEEKRQGQAGDPAFLHVAKGVIDTKLKLLNAFPKEDKTEINNVVQINWSDLSTPIPAQQVIDITPSSKIEDRINAEINSPKSNPLPESTNGNGKH